MSDFNNMFKPAPDHSLMVKKCQKFNHFHNNQSQSKDAIVYLKLRKLGCPKKEALSFTHKGTCRVDSTQNIDGPQHFRILKRQKIDSHKIKQGWFYDTPNYDLGKDYRQDAQEIILEDSQDEKLIDDINAHKEKKKKQHVSNTDQIKEYYEQLDNQFNFQQNEDLIDRNQEIQDLVQKKTLDLRTRKFFLQNNQKYVNLAEELYNYRINEDPDNIIVNQNPFNDIVLDKKIKDKKIYQEFDEQMLKYSNLQQTYNMKKKDTMTKDEQKELIDFIDNQTELPQYDEKNSINTIMDRQNKINEANIDWKQMDKIQKVSQSVNNLPKHLQQKEITQNKSSLQFNKQNMQDKIDEFNKQQYIFDEKKQKEQIIQNKELLQQLNQEQFNQLLKQFKEEEQQFKNIKSTIQSTIERKTKEKSEISMYNTLKDKKIKENNYFKNLDNLCQQSEQFWEKFVSRNLNPNTNRRNKSSQNYQRKYLQSTHTSPFTSPITSSNRKQLSTYQNSTNHTTKRNSIHNIQSSAQMFSPLNQAQLTDQLQKNKIKMKSMNTSPNSHNNTKNKGIVQMPLKPHVKKSLYYQSKFTNYNIKELTKDQKIIDKIQNDKIVSEAFEKGYQQSLQNILQYNSYRDSFAKINNKKSIKINKKPVFKVLSKYIEHQLNNVGHKIQDTKENNSSFGQDSDN